VNNEIVAAKVVADWLGVSERSVREMADKGIVVRSGRGQYDLKSSVQAVLRHQREIAAGRGGANQVLDLTAERARLAKEQADGQAIKNAISHGELVPASAVREQWEDIIQTARAALMAVPSRCAERLGLEQFHVESIDREIRDALEALANDADPEDQEDGDDGLEAAAED